MRWPAPAPGMVIRYSFLWSAEAVQGHEEGIKNRPCAIIIATSDVETGTRTHILPITHTPPSNPRDAVEIPQLVKTHLGLDSKRSWIVLNALNVFVWPGYDLRPVGRTGSPVYGMLPPTFFLHLRARFVAQRNPAVTNRT